MADTASNPSITGIWISISTRSYLLDESFSMATAPFSAVSITGTPIFSSSETATILLVSLSSTTSTEYPGGKTIAVPAASLSRVFPGRIFSGRKNRKWAPCSSSGSMDIVPPMPSTSRFEITRPRPVPPYFLVVEGSPWTKGRKSRPACSAEMPIPVSRTSTLRRHCLPSPGRMSPRTETSPFEVNFRAFPMILPKTWRILRESPETDEGTCPVRSILNRRFFCRALGRKLSRMLFQNSGKSKGASSKLSFPASILEKSRRSLISLSSDDDSSLRILTMSAWRESRAVSSSRLAMPIIPFRGVRISWLTLARKVSLALMASARLRSDSSSRSIFLLSSLFRPRITVYSSAFWSSPAAVLRTTVRKAKERSRISASSSPRYPMNIPMVLFWVVME